MKVLFYRIFCKRCQRDFDDIMSSFQLKEDNCIGDPINHTVLKCHWCNDYTIFVGENKISENFREGYFTDVPKEIIDAEPRFRFEWRELDERH